MRAARISYFVSGTELTAKWLVAFRHQDLTLPFTTVGLRHLLIFKLAVMLTPHDWYTKHSNKCCFYSHSNSWKGLGGRNSNLEQRKFQILLHKLDLAHYHGRMKSMRSSGVWWQMLAIQAAQEAEAGRLQAAGQHGQPNSFKRKSWGCGPLEEHLPNMPWDPEFNPQYYQNK